MLPLDSVIDAVRAEFPDVQAIYLFGSCTEADAGPESDLDVALLLPHATARDAGNLAMSDLRLNLEETAGCAVDLVNVRTVSTVFQTEIMRTGRPIYVADQEALAEFEMLTLSLYQKLNQERAAILHDAYTDGKVYGA